MWGSRGGRNPWGQTVSQDSERANIRKGHHFRKYCFKQVCFCLECAFYNKTQDGKMKNTWFKCFSSQVDRSYLNTIIVLSTLYFHQCSMMLWSRQVLSDCLVSEYIKCKSDRWGILQIFQCPVVPLMATGSSLTIIIGWWLLIPLHRKSWRHLEKQIKQRLKRNSWAQNGTRSGTWPGQVPNLA